MTTPATQIRFAHLASGARLAWAASGQGPTLVRAAHWMTHVEHDTRSAIWQPWLQQLGRELQVVRYDERGCGLSSADDTSLDLDSAVEELAVVIEATGQPRVALLGISGGSAPAIAYAAAHPERVSHLVLLGAYAAGALAGEPTAAKLAWIETTARLIELGWGQPGAPVQQFFTATLIPAGTPEQVRAMNEQQRVSCGAQRAAALFNARVRLDVRGLLAQVQCQTLVLHCEHDATVPAESGMQLAAAIPNARFQRLTSRNHIPLAGEPAFEEFCQAVTAFVRAPSPAEAAAGAPTFTPRERELLTWVARGKDNLQIAAQLGLADKTVRNALSLLYQRLGVEGRPQAIVRARELGYG